MLEHDWERMIKAVSPSPHNLPRLQLILETWLPGSNRAGRSGERAARASVTPSHSLPGAVLVLAVRGRILEILSVLDKPGQLSP